MEFTEKKKTKNSQTKELNGLLNRSRIDTQINRKKKKTRRNNRIVLGEKVVGEIDNERI